MVEIRANIGIKFLCGIDQAKVWKWNWCILVKKKKKVGIKYSRCRTIHLPTKKKKIPCWTDVKCTVELHILVQVIFFKKKKLKSISLCASLSYAYGTHLWTNLSPASILLQGTISFKESFLVHSFHFWLLKNQINWFSLWRVVRPSKIGLNIQGAVFMVLWNIILEAY